MNLGSTAKAIDRILVHWLNLPSLRSPHWIEADGARWTGGWQAEINGWSLTLDRRRDHKDVWPTLRDEQSIAITHVMEIRRCDGQVFTAEEAEPILNALQFGMSFALGRWVAPALPVGFDAAGQRIWEQWAPWFCDHGVNSGLAWWSYPRDEDLRDYLTRIFDAFQDRDRAESVRMLMAMAVGVNRGGFIEQRIITAMSAIEHLAWLRLKLEVGISRQQYKDLGSAGDRLRILLQRAGIPADIDAQLHPALAQFAVDEADPGEVLDGPAVAARIRNRIVHPDDRRDDIYRRDGLLTETWFLARHHLVLLLLHWIDYRGSYQRVLGPGGWAGNVEAVPWS